MIKKILFAVVAVFLVASAGVFLWARSVFTNDYVRDAIAAQLAEALGQPVTIGTIGVSIYPRVTVDLGTVSIGEPARIHVQSLHVGTNLRALLSRQIEHADVRLDGARVELPLPPLGHATPAERQGSRQDRSTRPGEPNASPPGTEDAGSKAPVTVVSIDEVVLNDVEIVSSGHTLRADIEAVPRGDGATIRRATLTADDTKVDAPARSRAWLVRSARSR